MLRDVRAIRALALVGVGVVFLIGSPAGAEVVSEEEGDSPYWDLDLDFGTGGSYITDSGYWSMSAMINARVYMFQALLVAPINLDTSDWSVRSQDWDEARDYARILRCFRGDLAWDGEPGARQPVPDGRGGQRMPDRFRETTGSCGSWENNLTRFGQLVSLRLYPLENITLGTGHVMSGFASNLDVDHYVLGAVGQIMFNEYIGGTAMLNDITRPEVMAGRLYIRPLGGNTDHHLDIGLTLATDLGAPAETLTAFGGARLVDDANNLIYTSDEVVIWGFDLKYKLQLPSAWELSANAEYAWIWDVQRDASEQVGNMGGHLSARLYWEPPYIPVSLYFYGEYRLVGSSYIPNYFDTAYMVQRAQYALTEGARARSVDPAFTKLGYMRYLAEEEAGLNHGYSAYFRLDLWRGNCPDCVRWLVFLAFIEQVVARDDSGALGLMLMMPNLFDRLTLSGAYIRRGFNNGRDMFSLEGSYMRYTAYLTNLIRQIPGLFLEINYLYRWRLRPETGYYEGAHDFVANVGYSQDF